METSTAHTSRKPLFLYSTLFIVLLVAGSIGAFYAGRSAAEKEYHVIPGFAWSSGQWAEKTKGIRTSYNPDHDLSTTQLTLTPGDPRWLDFVFWCYDNKITEHQVEAYGGTEWDGPKGGVIFHWAPGSRWETHTLASFGFTIGHIIGNHRWMDTQFPGFFQQYGGCYGVNVKDRIAEIDTSDPAVWVKFLDYIGGPASPYYRFIFHFPTIINPVNDTIYYVAGFGVTFAYSFDRFYHEVREVLTDAKAYQFFQMYDLYGPGFAAIPGWARTRQYAESFGINIPEVTSKWLTKPGEAGPHYVPDPPSPPLPPNLPDPDAVKRGEMVYKHQCVPCHGAAGDGKGFLAEGFDVQPRDFRQGIYKFRTTKTGGLPTFADVEHTIRVGVPNSTMPAWGDFLSSRQISDVAKYIATFSDRFADAWRAHKVSEVLSIPTAPADIASLSPQGKTLYVKFQCAKCHGESGVGNGPSADSLKDSWDNPIKSADLTYKWEFKNGYAPNDVYRTLCGGIDGSAMPSYDGAFQNDQERWALVSYVLSLSPSPRPVLHLSDFKAGVLAINQRLDDNGRVR